MDLLEFMMELNIWYYLAMKNMMSFTEVKKSQKSGIVYIISHNYARIKTDSCDGLPVEKTLTLDNIIILP